MKGRLDMEKMAEKAQDYFFEGKVRPHEVDSQQIVHNTAYLNWAECARFEYLDSLGFNVSELGLKNTDLVIKNISANYKKALVSGSTYKITCRMRILSKIKIELITNIFSEGSICCEVSVIGVAMYRDTKKLNKVFY